MPKKATAAGRRRSRASKTWLLALKQNNEKRDFLSGLIYARVVPSLLTGPALEVLDDLIVEGTSRFDPQRRAEATKSAERLREEILLAARSAREKLGRPGIMRILHRLCPIYPFCRGARAA